MKEMTFKLRLAKKDEAIEFRKDLYDNEQNVYVLTSDNLELFIIGGCKISQIIRKYKEHNNEL